jgi:hypothetical protein
MLDLKVVLEDLQDHLAPRLDTYELAIYLYVFRHTRLIGREEAVIGFKSARNDISFGRPKGKGRARMSEYTCATKLRSLERKGCVKILGSERTGTKVKLFLPSEISGLIPEPVHEVALDVEEMDFFNDPANRLLILERENHKCFYCLRALTESNYVIEHVVSRPDGNNSYRNVVAACLNCNNRKSSTSAEDFLRGLYREGFLGAGEFEDRLRALEQLRQGLLKPTMGSPPNNSVSRPR